ncbi:unnamed protein product [Parnassius mnemosyne]|uniref:Uncharacterized protein n=1 Tax=Parnassius mnemosyne TaxID=213953 RepID=A0AAV1LZA7_9NEOP
MQWISFKDLFLEAIHNNPTINKAQKMQHLKTTLRGEAERLVQHLSIGAMTHAGRYSPSATTIGVFSLHLSSTPCSTCL